MFFVKNSNILSSEILKNKKINCFDDPIEKCPIKPTLPYLSAVITQWQLHSLAVFCRCCSVHCKNCTLRLWRCSARSMVTWKLICARQSHNTIALHKRKKIMIIKTNGRWCQCFVFFCILGDAARLRLWFCNVGWKLLCCIKMVNIFWKSRNISIRKYKPWSLHRFTREHKKFKNYIKSFKIHFF